MNNAHHTEWSLFLNFFLDFIENLFFLFFLPFPFRYLWLTPLYLPNSVMNSYCPGPGVSLKNFIRKSALKPLFIHCSIPERFAWGKNLLLLVLNFEKNYFPVLLKLILYSYSYLAGPGEFILPIKEND